MQHQPASSYRAAAAAAAVAAYQEQNYRAGGYPFPSQNPYASYHIGSTYPPQCQSPPKDGKIRYVIEIYLIKTHHGKHRIIQTNMALKD